MPDNYKVPKQSYRDLFPSSTTIIDFAYSHPHPLRNGEFDIPVRKNRNSIPQDIEYEYFKDSRLTGGGGGGYDDDYNDDNEDYVYSTDEINRRAIALFDFSPENDNEVALYEGQVIWISYRHGQGWLVAEDPATGENGLVPEEYVEIFYGEDEEFDSNANGSRDDIPKPFLPEILQPRIIDHEIEHNHLPNHENESDSDWVDTDDDTDHKSPKPHTNDEDLNADTPQKTSNLPQNPNQVIKDVNDLLNKVTNVTIS